MSWKAILVLPLFSLFFSIISPSVALSANCSVPAPLNLSAQQGSENGQVTLNWNPPAVPHHYVLVYGTESNKYSFGDNNIPKNASSYTVSHLNPETKYFFKVGAAQNCVSFSSEVSQIAKGNSSKTSSNVLGVTSTGKTHTVLPGDSLSKIAARFYGNMTLFNKIAQANGIQNPNIINAGAVLNIP